MTARQVLWIRHKELRAGPWQGLSYPPSAGFLARAMRKSDSLMWAFWAECRPPGPSYPLGALVCPVTEARSPCARPSISTTTREGHPRYRWAHASTAVARCRRSDYRSPLLASRGVHHRQPVD